MVEEHAERQGVTLDFSAAFEATPTPCLVLDSRLSIVGVNAAYLAATTSILERLGYRVLSRSSPFEALESKDEGTRVDLLMTDVILPQMNGREFARRFAEKRGRVRTIFVSGYSDDVIADQSLLEEGDGFLQKPFTPESLSRKVREILDASRH